METADYSKTRDAAIAEIQEILLKRAALDERLNQLKKIVDALSALLDDVPEVNPRMNDGHAALSAALLGTGMGISNAIRQALASSNAPMSPIDIREILANSGFDFGKYASAMTVIHNTLKRLEAQGEFIGVRNKAGQVVAYALPGSPGVTLPTQNDLAQEADRIAHRGAKRRK
jgi:hypothetical protein